MFKAAQGRGAVTWSPPGARLKMNGWLVPQQLGKCPPLWQASVVR